MRARALFIFLLAACLSGFSQEEAPGSNKSQPYIQVQYHIGSFWSRTEYLQEQFDAGYWGLEARLGFQTTGRKMWQQEARYPKYGLGFYYADLVMNKDDTIVGNPVALFAFYNASIFSYKRFTLGTDLSVGMSYTPIIADPVTNPYNDVLASHWNLFFGFKLNMDVELTPRLGVNLGYGLTHHSNGRVHVPQTGVNTWGWSTGMTYIIAEPVERIHTEAPEFLSHSEVQFMGAVGTMEEIPFQQILPNRYYSASLTVDYAYKFNPRMALTLGLDCFYDSSNELAIGNKPTKDVETYQKMYYGAHMGYQLGISRITFIFNLGTYILKYTPHRGIWYARAGGRIRLMERLHFHLAVKTKAGVRSDWIEWGLAYHLKVKTHD